MKQLKRLGAAPVPSLLRELTIPAIVGMFVTAFYNVVDRLYVGQGCGSDAIAGISVTFPFMALLTAFGTLIGVGSGAVLSLRLGEHKRIDAERVLGQCIAVKVIFFIILPAILYLFLDPLLRFFGATPQALPYAHTYMAIFLIGDVFCHLSYGLANQLRAEGMSKQSMYCLAAGAFLNILLDPLFIFVFDWGIAGAAWASNLSMFATTVYALSYYLRKKTSVRLRWQRIRIYPVLLREVFAIGLSPFFLQIMMGTIVIAFNQQFLRWIPNPNTATLQIAAMGIVNTLLFLFLIPVFGLTQGMQPIIGYNYGAKIFDRVQCCFKLSMKTATLFCLLSTALIHLFAVPMLRCFTTDPELIRIGARGLRIYSCMFPFIGIPIVVIAYFQSIGRAKMAIILSMMRQFLLLLPMILLFPYCWGVMGIWIAAPASDLLSSIITDWVAFKEFKKMKKEIP